MLPAFWRIMIGVHACTKLKAEWAKKIPLRRGGTPEDVANIATFLASDMSSYVSGQVIQVDGGMNM